MSKTTFAGTCPACGQAGSLAYDELEDRLFGATGQWQMQRCAASDCRLLYLDPAPTGAELDQAYEDYYTHAGDDEHQPSTPGHRIRRQLIRIWASPAQPTDPLAQRLVRLVLQGLAALLPPLRANLDAAHGHLGLPASGFLLEIGVGDGSFLDDMQALGWQVHGVDPDPRAVARAQSRGLPVSIGTVEQVAPAPAGYAAILMLHVFEHLADAPETLKHCAGLLRPGGHLVITTPNANALGHRWFGRHWRGLEPPRHLQVFTQKALKRMAGAAGFEVVRCTTTLHWSRGMLAQSVKLALFDGRASLPGRLFCQFLGMGLFLVEWACWLFNRDCAEELLLVARLPHEGGPS